MTLVLIVDDVPAMAEQYAYDLKRLRGYETLIAKSGRTALESLTRDSVDCVILDLEMPGMDGFEVLRSVERLGLRVPIIVYTGTATTTAARKRSASARTASSTKPSRWSASHRKSRTRSNGAG
jgi:CheY-like chemotaxis protein